MSTDVKSVNGTTVICVFWLHWVFTLVVVRSNFVYGEELANTVYGTQCIISNLTC